MTVGKHAVVIGASMAGLGCARALANHFERVTLVERDTLLDEPVSRKGTPQASHAHGVLPSGFRIMDAYFPGMMDELEAEGAIRGDLTGDFLWYQCGAWKLRADSGLGGIVVTRPLLERQVRRHVRAHRRITVLENHDALEPVFDGARVTGLRVRKREGGQASALDAELVVDASGRGSIAPRWLAGWGFGDVPEELVRIDVGYATGIFERRPSDLYGAMGAIIAGTVPKSTRFAAVLGAERDRWVITLVGAVRDYPPTELAGYRAFARELPTTDVSGLIEGREPLAPLAGYRFPANRRLRYDTLARFPEGFLVLGDALCSFNPVFGQGMSVAMSEAKALDDCLASGTGQLARRFFGRAKAITDSPWTIATGEDLRYPQVEGKRPPGFAVISRYMDRVHLAASRDPKVLRRFFEVASLLAPPTAVMAPDIAWRVLLGGVGGAQPAPSHKLA
jgi:2-polyprenyl-6-methoxyphenol hydroxylase-like FAD-dependent oxidoreductase